MAGMMKTLGNLIRNRRVIEVKNTSPQEMAMPMVPKAIKNHVPEIQMVKPMMPKMPRQAAPMPVTQMPKLKTSVPPLKPIKTAPDGFYGQGARDFSKTMKKLNKAKY